MSQFKITNHVVLHRCFQVCCYAFMFYFVSINSGKQKDFMRQLRKRRKTSQIIFFFFFFFANPPGLRAWIGRTLSVGCTFSLRLVSRGMLIQGYFLPCLRKKITLSHIENILESYVLKNIVNQASWFQILPGAPKENE